MICTSQPLSGFPIKSGMTIWGYFSPLSNASYPSEGFSTSPKAEIGPAATKLNYDTASFAGMKFWHTLMYINEIFSSNIDFSAATTDKHQGHCASRPGKWNNQPCPEVKRNNLIYLAHQQRPTLPEQSPRPAGRHNRCRQTQLHISESSESLLY